MKVEIITDNGDYDMSHTIEAHSASTELMGSMIVSNKRINITETYSLEEIENG